jgi:hypothetical protein
MNGIFARYDASVSQPPSPPQAPAARSVYQEVSARDFAAKREMAVWAAGKI